MNGKGQATVIAGSLATILIWVLNAYIVPPPGIPQPVNAAITALLCACAAILTPSQANPIGKSWRLVKNHSATKATRKFFKKRFS